MARQLRALAQVPFQFDARGRGVGRLHFAGRAVERGKAREPVAEALGVVHAQRVERGDGALHRGGVDLVRIGGNGEVGIGVAQRFVGVGGERVDEVAQQLSRGRRAHADREGQARILGDAVVRHAGRQVEHVAGREDPVVRRMEVAAAA